MENNTTAIQLPEELQRKIFEIVARLNSRDAAMLLTVEKRVYHWIKPLLYEVIVDNTTPHSEDWYTEHGKHIHHLLMLQNYAQYIRHCPDIHNLAMWAVVSPREMIHLETLRLRRLSVQFSALFESADAFQKRARAPKPLFPDLTHLDLIEFWGEWEGWSGIALLPRLTHLGVGDESAPVVQGALDHCQHLRVVVIISQDGDMAGGVKVRQREDGDQDDDHRVVHIEVGQFSEDWEAGARGCLDAWSLADKIVEARIRRCVPPRDQDLVTDGLGTPGAPFQGEFGS